MNNSILEKQNYFIDINIKFFGKHLLPVTEQYGFNKFLVTTNNYELNDNINLAFIYYHNLRLSNNYDPEKIINNTIVPNVIINKEYNLNNTIN